MTPRPFARMRRGAALAAAAGLLLTLTGCDPRSLFYFLQPWGEPKLQPPCEALEGKRVVVITKAAPGTRNDFPGVERELNREVVALLRDQVKKIDIVDPEKVYEWDEAKPTWTDPADIARDFDADAVVFLEMQHFQTDSPNDPGLFHGESDVAIQVTELKAPEDDRGRPIPGREKTAEVIYRDVRETQYPVTGHYPADAGTGREGFKNKFLRIVAQEISWHFVEHAVRDGIHDTRMNR